MATENAENFNYKKCLGQNFIYDLNFLRSVVRELEISAADRIIEIGAGAGTLTKVLAETGAKIRAFEIDERLKPILTREFTDMTISGGRSENGHTAEKEKTNRKCQNVEIVWGDILKISFDAEPQFRVVANVPYYITTPIIFRFLYLDNCRDINILVAKEVAERITARPGTPQYGALSVACQTFGECNIIRSVPRTLFTPQPKVDSAFVRIKKIGGVNADKGMLSNLLKYLFAQRRKMILNGLAAAENISKERAEEILKQCGIAPTLRPENIPPSKFVELCQNIAKLNK